MADVEEEVRAALVVTVLEQLGERELEEILVEADGPLDVGAQQRHVVHAPSRARGSSLTLAQVLVTKLGSTSRQTIEIQVSTHRCPP